MPLDEDDEAVRRSRRRKKIAEAKYDVGYGKPSIRTQFQPGNPGRPPGSKNKQRRRQDDTFLRRFGERRRLRHDVGGKRLTREQIFIDSIFKSVPKENPASQKLYSALMLKAEQFIMNQRAEMIEIIETYLQEVNAELAYCRQYGLDKPRIYPSPDDIHLDPATNSVIVRGPISEAEAVALTEADRPPSSGPS